MTNDRDTLILPGDVVTATVVFGSMTSNPIYEDITGVVIDTQKDYAWRHQHTEGTLRDAKGESYHFEMRSVKAILHVGAGEVIPGVTFQFTEDELKQQRLE